MHILAIVAIVSAMGPDKSASAVRNMFASIAGRYDLTNTVLSFGIHHFWRRMLLRHVPQGGNVKALDLCTGTGDLLNPLAKRCGYVVGVDFCHPMLKRARAKSLMPILVGDALQLPFDESSFDVLSVAFGVRNFENLDSGLREMARVLRPGGKALILEFGQPRQKLFGEAYRIYGTYMMPLLGAAVTGNKAAYTYLPQTVRSFPAGQNFCTVLEEAGFERSEFQPLSGGIAFLYTALKHLP